MEMILSGEKKMSGSRAHVGAIIIRASAAELSDGGHRRKNSIAIFNRQLPIFNLKIAGYQVGNWQSAIEN
jgi:hypothetical protein